jgi:2-iminobutanoate/2-iminopropanoate deaminase
MGKEIINVGATPSAPYSHCVKVGNLVFLAGQIGWDLKTGKLVAGGIKAETRRTLENLKAVLKAAGGSLDEVVNTTVYVVDMASDYAGMNEVYREFFPQAPPARATVQVDALALGARVEIAVIAVL